MYPRNNYRRCVQQCTLYLCQIFQPALSAVHKSRDSGARSKMEMCNFPINGGYPKKKIVKR